MCLSILNSSLDNPIRKGSVTQYRRNHVKETQILFGKKKTFNFLHRRQEKLRAKTVKTQMKKIL